MKESRKKWNKIWRLFDRDKILRTYMDGIIFIGNPPMNPSGYGKQLALLQKYLKGRYEMAHICDYGYKGPSFFYNGVKVYGVSEYPGTIDTKYISNCIQNFIESKPIDKWLVVGLGNLYNRGILESFPSLLLAPVETEDLNEHELHSLASSIPVAISEFGKSAMEKHGIECLFKVPHAVDVSLMPTETSVALRSAKDWPFDSTKYFVAGFFGDFSPRKSPKLVEQLWQQFSVNKPDVRLWIHHSNHIDMDKETFATLSSLPNVFVTTTKEGWDDKTLLRKLKSLDCLLHPSNREAFGVFQAEAQCVGTPVVSCASGPAIEVNMHPSLVSPEMDVGMLEERLNFVYNAWSKRDFTINAEIQNKALKQFSPEKSFAGIFDALNYCFQTYYPPIKHSVARKAKHVCIMSTWDTDCGIATYTHMLASELHKHFKVTILAEGAKKRDYQPFGDVIHCWNRRYPSAGSVKGVLDALNPDVLLIQHETSLFKMQADLMEGLYDIDAKIAVTLHTPDFSNNEVALVSSHADLTILHNKGLAERMNGSLPNAVQHIPHGVKQIEVQPNRRDTNVPDGIPLLFNFGFCSPTKGVLEFIRACKLLKSGELLDSEGEPLTTTHFEVVIYASKSNPDYYDRCLEEASSCPGLTISNDILPEEGIDFWAVNSDFIVFPYSPSGHPYQVNSTSGALMRVLSAGKPIIATDEGRLRDVVGGIHGWKSGMGSVESLALSIRDAVNKFNFKKKIYHEMSDNVLELSRKNSWTRVAEMHAKSFKELTGLHHYRTQTLVLKPQARKHEPPLFGENDGGEEE